jgi:hypothetical protein
LGDAHQGVAKVIAANGSKQHNAAFVVTTASTIVVQPERSRRAHRRVESRSTGNCHHTINFHLIINLYFIILMNKNGRTQANALAGRVLAPLGHGFHAQRDQVHKQVAHHPHTWLSAFHFLFRFNIFSFTISTFISLLKHIFSSIFSPPR